MGVSSISGYSPVPSPPTGEMQNRISEQGQQQTAQIAEKDDYIIEVSNFGTQTNYGRSNFQQGNKTIAQEGNRNVSTIMKRASDYLSVSNFGNEPQVGKSDMPHISASQAASYKASKQGNTLGSSVSMSM